MKILALLPVLALSAPVALATGLASDPAPATQDPCAVRQELDRELDAAGLQGVLIEAGAGALEVVGTDASEVRVRGVLCASDDDMAAESRLILERRQDAAWVETVLPEGGGWGNDYARLDLIVEMPRTLAADIEDGAGELMVSGIAAVAVDDGSGEIQVETIAGEVRIDDGSGDIRVRDAGSVTLEDGSGGIELADIRGGVRVTEDGSGEIDIRNVVGDVVIDEDGSGSIEVVGVGGDFIVEDDGSGSIRYDDVRGRVSIPPQR